MVRTKLSYNNDLVFEWILNPLNTISFLKAGKTLTRKQSIYRHSINIIDKRLFCRWLTTIDFYLLWVSFIVTT